MYETLIMLKPGTSFSVDEMNSLVVRVSQRGRTVVNRERSQIYIRSGSNLLNISWNNLPHVVEESDEIAERFNIPSQGCVARFEMYGDDADMELFNDYLIINEQLQATGKFVIFDSAECKLMFP